MVALITSTTMMAQVAINTDGSQPDASALLDLKSTSAGMLAPRMTLAQRDAIVAPATGLLVFQTDNTPGFYYYNGTAWTSIGSAAALQDLGYDPATNTVTITGGTGATLPLVTSTAAGLAPAMPDNTTTFLRGDGVWAAPLAASAYWSANGSDIYNSNAANVGIGTTTPATKLEVSGTFGSFSLNPDVNQTNTLAALQLRSNAGNGTFVAFAESGVADKWYLGSKPFDNNLYFGTGWVGGAYDDKVTITSSGAVGIGTTSPQSRLDVSGTNGLIALATDVNQTNTLAALQLRSNAGNGTFVAFAESGVADKWYLGSKPFDNNLYFGTGWVGGAYDDKVTITSSGAVGIGTTAPGASLDVNGTLAIRGGSPGAGKVLVSDAAGVASWGTPATVTTYWSANGDAIYNSNVGYVGIGTSNPQSKLDVSGTNGGIHLQPDVNQTNTLAALHVVSSTGNGGFVAFAESGVADKWYLGSKPGDNNLYFGTGWVGGAYDDKVTISSSGSVGIGSTTPGAKLDVSGANGGIYLNPEVNQTNTLAALQVRSNAGNGTFVAFAESGVADKWYLGSKPGDNNLYFGTGWVGGAYNDKVTISSSGSVGIGTTAPNASAILDLSSTSRGFLPPKMTTAQRDAISGPAEGLIIYNTDSHNVQFFNGTSWING